MLFKIYFTTDQVLLFTFVLSPKPVATSLVIFYLSDHPPPTDTPKSKLNGLILTVCQTLKNGVASAAEAETGGVPQLTNNGP